MYIIQTAVNSIFAATGERDNLQYVVLALEGPSVIGNLQCVVLDCPDVLELAPFYQSLLGGTINQPDPRWSVNDDFSTLHAGCGLVLAFQRVKDYRAPRWPDTEHPQQFHLDLDVADLDDAHRQVLDLGATLLRVDPRGLRIFADPAGHPFCLLSR